MGQKKSNTPLCSCENKDKGQLKCPTSSFRFKVLDSLKLIRLGYLENRRRRARSEKAEEGQQMSFGDDRNGPKLTARNIDGKETLRGMLAKQVREAPVLPPSCGLDPLINKSSYAAKEKPKAEFPNLSAFADQLFFGGNGSV